MCIVAGNYCGTACNGRNFRQSPKDAVDACCKEHDSAFKAAGNTSFMENSPEVCGAHHAIAACMDAASGSTAATFSDIFTTLADDCIECPADDSNGDYGDYGDYGN